MLAGLGVDNEDVGNLNTWAGEWNLGELSAGLRGSSPPTHSCPHARAGSGESLTNTVWNSRL